MTGRHSATEVARGPRHLDPVRPIPMSPEAVEQIRQRVCGAKRRHGCRAAWHQADRLNAENPDAVPPFVAYRCPFSPDTERHWHVGHLISRPGMEQLARAIRVLGAVRCG